MNTPSKNKPSKLEEFKLFYEQVDAPAYLTGTGQTVAPKATFRDRRITRRRK